MSIDAIPSLHSFVHRIKTRRTRIRCFFIFAVSLVLTACHHTAYVCALSKQTGACASQWQAYQATRFFEADNDSIFNGTQNTDANDDYPSHATAAASSIKTHKDTEKNKPREKTGKLPSNFLLTPAAVIER